LKRYSENRLIAGTNIIWEVEVCSTNTHLISLLNSSKLPGGTVIIASHQTAGRGQIGNRWHSEAGKNLTFSMVIYPGFLDLQKQFLLNMAVSLALVDYLKAIIPDVYIKWPNDIYISHKKIAGILVENSVSGNQIKQTVIGIGLNINQTLFPPDLPNPTSLALETGRKFELEEVTELILNFLDARLLQLKSEKFERLHTDYLKYLYRINKPYLFDVNGETVEGIIKNVDDTGHLIVEIADELRTFGFKEIKYLYEIWN